MTKARDPNGKNALYWKSVGDDALIPNKKNESSSLKDTGRRAVFSDTSKKFGQEDLGSIQLECSSCKEISYVELAEYLRLHFPLFVWIPFKSHSRLLKCPSCKKVTWLKVRITLLAKELNQEN